MAGDGELRAATGRRRQCPTCGCRWRFLTGQGVLGFNRWCPGCGTLARQQAGKPEIISIPAQAKSHAALRELLARWLRWQSAVQELPPDDLYAESVAALDAGKE